MTLAIWFWLLFVLLVLVGVPKIRERAPAVSGGVLTLILLGLLGWAVFGGPIK